MDRSALVGRAAELDHLVEATSSPGRLVLLEGQAGVGKTRLLEAFADCVRAGGRSVDSIYALPSLSDASLAALAPIGLPVGDDLALVVSWYLGRWKAASRQAPTTVTIDDLPALDPASLAIVLQGVVADLVTVVATARTGQPLPDEFTRILATERGVSLAIESLERPDTIELVRLLRPDFTDRATDEIWSRSKGNPLYVRELVASHGSACESATSLPDLIGRRVRALTPDEREALDRIALAGSIDVELARLIADRSHLDALIGLGLVESTRSGRCGVSHPLIVEWIEADLGDLLRRRLVDMAQKVESAGFSEAYAIESAWWTARAGAKVPTGLAERAAGELVARFDTARALLVIDAAEPGSARLDAFNGTCLAIIGDSERAKAVLTEVLNGSDEGAIVVAAKSLALMHALFEGDADAAVRVVQKASTRVKSGGATATIASVGLHLQLFTGAGVPMRPSEILHVAREPDVPPAVAIDLISIGITSLTPTSESYLVFDEGLELAWDLAPRIGQAPEVLSQLASITTWRRFMSGGVEAAQCFIEDLLRDTLLDFDEPIAFMSTGLEALLSLASGRLDSAALIARTAEALYPAGVASRHLEMYREVASFATALSHARGDGERILLADLEPAASPFEAGMRALRCLAMTSPGDPDRLHVSAAMGRLHATVPAFVPIYALFGLSAEDVPEAFTDLVTVEGIPVFDIVGRYIAASHAANAEGLHLVADDFMAYGLHLPAARSYAKASVLTKNVVDRYVAATRCESALRHVTGLHPSRHPVPSNPFSQRQAEVVQAAARGLTDREIANELGLALRTVGNYLHRAYQTLGIGGRQQLREIGERTEYPKAEPTRDPIHLRFFGR